MFQPFLDVFNDQSRLSTATRTLPVSCFQISMPSAVFTPTISLALTWLDYSTAAFVSLNDLLDSKNTAVSTVTDAKHFEFDSHKNAILELNKII